MHLLKTVLRSKSVFVGRTWSYIVVNVYEADHDDDCNEMTMTMTVLTKH